MAPNLRPLGALIQANPARLLLALTGCLLLLSLAIRSAKLDGRIASWLQKDPQLAHQLELAHSAMPEGTGSSGQLLLQTPRRNKLGQPETDLLTVQSFMVHLEALGVATHVTVDLFDVTWTLKDLCFTPSLPDFDGLHASLVLENMFPCAIKTPLDCFWEGAKLHGPDQPVSMGGMGPMLKWTSLNPLPMVEALQQNHPHASFPYQALLAWMKRVGITSGYQLKPCLDPTDPNCPDTAPNKLDPIDALDLGAAITGGCRGVAANQMHWREDELVAGVERNRSTSNINKVEALQSTIELMGEQDMYDYWRKTSKVQDINNWSPEKARLIIESWQVRFSQELGQFARTLPASSAFEINTVTSRSIQEPMDAYSLLDLTNLEYCFILMSLFTCAVYPNLNLAESSSLNLLKRLLLALVSSSAVGLTLVASLGAAAFMDVPFNMATLQIFPPLGLLYGFSHNLMVAHIFFKRSQQTDLHVHTLTSDCLNQIFPILVLESSIFVVSLGAASIIPIMATRVFATITLIHILLTFLSTLLLIPSIVVTFISCRTPTSDFYAEDTHQDFSSDRSQFKPRVTSPFRFFASRSESKLGANDKSSETKTSIEEQIFSRIQDDLRNIRVDSCQPTSFNISAHLESGRLTTTFNLTTSQTPSSEENSDSLSYNRFTQEAPPDYKPIDPSSLPDLITSSTSTVCRESELNNKSDLDDLELVSTTHRKQENSNSESLLMTSMTNILKLLALDHITHILVGVIMICSLVAMFTQVDKINYGLSFTDIVARGTVEHDAFNVQETYFPIYNIFAITQGNFDYPTNQKLLHQYFDAIETVAGVTIAEKRDTPKFWLINFRDWLLELQHSFDYERNKSLISTEGWTEEASDHAKLAYKLLAQTGKSDNPINKSLVETNRLVDSSGIINQKAFYYYLGAWVTNDPFTYATSEANFKPEPKTWNYNQDDLRVEKARPIMYAQIPFLLKLPTTNDNLKTISQMRKVSRSFESLNLPNILTGVPFIFWDQFTNLKPMIAIAIVAGLIGVFIISAFLTSDLNSAVIVTIPMGLTIFQLYCFLGIISVQLNNVLAVLLVGGMGFATTQAIYHVTFYHTFKHDTHPKVTNTIVSASGLVLKGFILMLICAVVFQQSRMNFMNKYSKVIFCYAILNVVNSFVLAPVLMGTFVIRSQPDRSDEPRIAIRTTTKKKTHRTQSKISHKVYKKRACSRVQSKISLSTISEEPTISEIQKQDMKLDFSIRCF